MHEVSNLSSVGSIGMDLVSYHFLEACTLSFASTKLVFFKDVVKYDTNELFRQGRPNFSHQKPCILSRVAYFQLLVYTAGITSSAVISSKLVVGTSAFGDIEDITLIGKMMLQTDYWSLSYF